MAAEDLRNNGNSAREKRIHNWQGIKFFHGSPLPDIKSLRQLVPAVTVEYLRETKHVWRPEETVEAAKLFFGLEGSPDHRLGIRVIGEPQSGKGTFLFGISDICDALGIGYVFIDGHHQEVDGAVVAETITKAQEMNIPIFFDSTDYLFLKSRKAGRSISKAAQEKRAQLIVEAIDTTSIPIAVTSHDKEWAQEYLDLELRDKYQHVFDKFPKYHIPENLQSEASVRRFLLDHDMPDNVVNYLVNMHKDEFARDVLLNLIDEIYYPSFCPYPVAAVDNIFAAIYTYPVLKDLAKRYGKHTINLVNATITMQQTNQKKAIEALKNLGWLISNLDDDRKHLTMIRRKKLPSKT